MRRFDKKQRERLPSYTLFQARMATAVFAIPLAESLINANDTRFYWSVMLLFLVWSIWRMQQREIRLDVKMIMDWLVLSQFVIQAIGAWFTGSSLLRLIRLFND